MMLRLGRFHHDTAYLQSGDEPSSDDERVAVFMGPDALHWAVAFVYAMNAVREDCNCNVICPQCGNFTGESAERACEYCKDHRIECEPKRTQRGNRPRGEVIRSYDRTNVHTDASALGPPEAPH